MFKKNFNRDDLDTIVGNYLNGKEREKIKINSGNDLFNFFENFLKGPTWLPFQIFSKVLGEDKSWFTDGLEYSIKGNYPKYIFKSNILSFEFLEDKMLDYDSENFEIFDVGIGDYSVWIPNIGLYLSQKVEDTNIKLRRIDYLFLLKMQTSTKEFK